MCCVQSTVLAGGTLGHANAGACRLGLIVMSAGCRRCVQVSELDPDASGRQRRPLHPENVADEERILSRLWRLVRAGLLWKLVLTMKLQTLLACLQEHRPAGTFSRSAALL